MRTSIDQLRGEYCWFYLKPLENGLYMFSRFDRRRRSLLCTDRSTKNSHNANNIQQVKLSRKNYKTNNTAIFLYPYKHYIRGRKKKNERSQTNQPWNLKRKWWKKETDFFFNSVAKETCCYFWFPFFWNPAKTHIQNSF